MAEMREPGPDHPITIAAAGRRMRARMAGHVIADTLDALVLTEAGYKPVVYFPRDDVEMGYFGRTARATHCPYKGEASYFTLDLDGEIAENAAWSYEAPYPAMSLIAGRIAFYPHPVEVYEAGPIPAADPGAVVRHTDDGAGAAQADRWPVTAPNPE